MRCQHHSDRPCNECEVNMDRKAEILSVKQLGESIGYGNMMDIASALWAEKLEKSVGTSEGAFIPTILQDIKPIQKKEYKERQTAVRNEISCIV
jgi:hypothetical protein